MALSSKVRTENGIEWHYEQQGNGPNLVLIPSGEGDCASFAKVASILSKSYTVTTFDMPGMSRTKAPLAAMENLTWSRLAAQIIGLMDELSIEIATFFGSSSGGCAALTLMAEYPHRVRNTIVHEVPLEPVEIISNLVTLDDSQLVTICREMFSTFMNEDIEAWKNLGPEFHARLDKNYITWIRYYSAPPLLSLSKEQLTRRPVAWTIGALMPAGAFFKNVVVACDAAIPISTLPCKHFPYVTIPEKLAKHIQDSISRVR